MSLALAVFEAATALVDTRIAAIRQCVDVEDTEVVIDTEALAARAAAWRSEVLETIRIITESSGVATTEASRSAADDRFDEVSDEWSPYIYNLKRGIQVLEQDAGEELAAVRKAGFENDRVFAYLLKRNARTPQKRFSFADRLIAKWSGFGEELSKYRATVAFPGARAEWIAIARKAVAEAESIVDTALRERNDVARAAQSVRDEASSVVERAWITLVDLLAEDAPAFSDIDLDAACGVAREAAAAGLRNGTTEVPLVAEQEERLGALADSRKDLKLQIEWLESVDKSIRQGNISY